MSLLCADSIPLVLGVRRSHDRRKQIFHLFLVKVVCSKGEAIRRRCFEGTEFGKQPDETIWQKDNAMQRMCREVASHAWRARQRAAAELLRHARIVTDPIKLAFLKAEVLKRRARPEGDRLRAGHKPAL